MSSARARARGIWRIALFVCGILILGLNVAGLFRSLKNPEIYQETRTLLKNDIRAVDEDERLAARRPREHDVDYIYRVNRTVSERSRIIRKMLACTLTT